MAAQAQERIPFGLVAVVLLAFAYAAVVIGFGALQNAKKCSHTRLLGQAPEIVACLQMKTERLPEGIDSLGFMVRFPRAFMPNHPSICLSE